MDQASPPQTTLDVVAQSAEHGAKMWGTLLFGYLMSAKDTVSNGIKALPDALTQSGKLFAPSQIDAPEMPRNQSVSEIKLEQCRAKANEVSTPAIPKNVQALANEVKDGDTCQRITGGHHLGECELCTGAAGVANAGKSQEKLAPSDLHL